MDEGQEVINLLCTEAGLDFGGLWKSQEVSCFRLSSIFFEAQFPGGLLTPAYLKSFQ
jgi:hypothetical protein